MTLKQLFCMKFQYFKFTTPPRNLSKANLENVLEGFLTFLLGFSVSLSFSCFCSYRLNVKIVSVCHHQSGVHIPKYVEFSQTHALFVTRKKQFLSFSLSSPISLPWYRWFQSSAPIFLFTSLYDFLSFLW